MRRPGLVLLLILAGNLAAGGAVGAAADRDDPPLDARAALLEGNRHFRDGRLEAAVETYRRGVREGELDPVLAYNLGTALHRLGRLPEAVLWYRRAQAAGSPDPWLDENLERARADLGTVRRGPPPALAPALLYPWLPGALATVLAWASLLTALLAPPRWRRAAGLLLAAALATWGGAFALRRLGPKPAVLLTACGPALPAGSEVWGLREPSGDFRLSGGEICPGDAVAPLAPIGPPGGWWAPGFGFH
jgi:tetratricopeptide (TPR) repeat protein